MINPVREQPIKMAKIKEMSSQLAHQVKKHNPNDADADTDDNDELPARIREYTPAPAPTNVEDVETDPKEEADDNIQYPSVVDLKLWEIEEEDETLKKEWETYKKALEAEGLEPIDLPEEIVYDHDQAPHQHGITLDDDGMTI